MCKHILNAKVYIQSPCCKKWFECAECHDENCDHALKFASRLRFTCKNCKVCFFQDFRDFSEADKKCAACGTVWVLPGITPESILAQETSQMLSQNIANAIDLQNHFFNDFNF